MLKYKDLKKNILLLNWFSVEWMENYVLSIRCELRTMIETHHPIFGRARVAYV